MSFESVIPVVENILILDSEGKRIAVKYYGENKYAQRPRTCFLAEWHRQSSSDQHR